MKRPGVVWVFTILVVLGIIWELFGALLFFSGFGTMKTIPVLLTIVGLLLIIPRCIMIAKFFMLQKNALMWVHISSGLVLFLGLINTIIYFATVDMLGMGLVAAPSLFVMGMYIFFWWAIVDYIKKKQIDGQPVFT